MQRLAALAEKRGIYLIVDNAYGQPFPNVIFKPALPALGRNTFHTFSLSKLGLPATRTGMVVADKGTIERLSIMNASLVLSTSSIGQAIVGSLFAGDEMAETCVMRSGKSNQQWKLPKKAWYPRLLLPANQPRIIQGELHPCDRPRSPLLDPDRGLIG
jgi:alanine-alpha-ketoisovalerate/valine-pyruvate aminotransferase